MEMQTSGQHNDNSIRDDEVDLGPILNSLRGAWKNVIHSLSIAGKAIQRYYIQFLFIVLLALVVGYGIFKIQKPVYYSSMVLTSQYLPPVYYHHIISELDLLIDDENYEQLARKLDIPVKTAEQFHAMYYIPLVVEEDTVTEYQPFRVVLASHDGQIFNEITQPISQFLDQNEFAQRQKSIRINQLQTSIATLEQEIQQLDNLKKVMEKSLLQENTTSTGFSLTESPDPVSVYEQKMELYNIKQYNQSQLAQKENIQVIYPFTVRTRADEPNLLLTLTLALLAGLIIGILYVSRQFKRAIN